MALKSSQLELNNQDVIGIIGENGAGKSTLLQLIAGLLKPKQGLFWLNQQKLTGKAKLKYSFVVMQNVRMQLFFESVEKELGNGTNEIKNNELIELLSLQKLFKRRPQSLSGGQQQLVAIATALLSNKQFILFDEPTSGLDYETMLHLSQIINKIRQRKVLIIIVSHDLDFINMTCSRVIEMSHGQIKTMNRGQAND
ncbi:ATP-binding cassette domain-containing protein [Paucilactobacillus oligofermentans]